MAVITMREALNQALAEEMRRDGNVFLMGEEVAAYQGAYKVSKGLLEEFGEKRVIDSPITELGFAGLGVGAAMVGLRPVIEFMTFNFSILATDQIINSAAKMLYMSGGQFNIPIVFRGPNGSAYQVSSQHSQALESWFAHFPGIKVVMPSTPADAKGLLKSSIRDDDPVIFLEQERMYGVKGEVPDGDDFTIPLGVSDVKREGTDCTIVAGQHNQPLAV
jgi:pyruvate dehydrogenase E1 component beta subunit